MKVLVLGKGFISDHLNYIKCFDKLYNKKDIQEVIIKYKPDTIINCIGKTGRPNIDSLEKDKISTYLTNTVLPSLIAEVCLDNKIHFINIGSGCIYYGDSPDLSGWKETDFANPVSYYSKTKYAADLILNDLDITTLRIRMPISYMNTERNFINKVSGYSKVINIQNSVTFMEDFVNCIDWVVKNRILGTFHVTNPDTLSIVDVLKEYQKYKPINFSIISEKELEALTVAKRSNCILNTEKLNKAGFFMMPAEEALIKCMARYFK